MTLKMAALAHRCTLGVLFVLATSSFAADVSRQNGDPLLVDERAVVQLSAVNENGALWIGMCGSTSGCILVQLEGVSDSGAMRYWQGVTVGSKDITTGFTEWSSVMRGPRNETFVPGQNYKFVVHRRSHTWFAIWPEGKYESRFALHLPVAQSLLNVVSSAGPVMFL